jgi:hypothetical protein
MYSYMPGGELMVLKDFDLTLSAMQAYSTSSSTLVVGSETLVISVLTWQHGSIEGVKYREHFYEMTKVNYAISASLELLHEFPELAPLVEKLIGLKPLDEVDKSNLRELVEATGWSVDDIVDELRSVWKNPLDRVDRYRNMFEKYYGEALELVDKDPRQAAEKLWGAITALVKLHAALKGVFIAHWSHGKLYNYVTHNVEERYRKLFYDLLKTGEVLHRYFYEEDLDRDTFNIHWIEALKLLDEAKHVVYKLYTKVA